MGTAIEGLSESIDDPTEQSVPKGRRWNARQKSDPSSRANAHGFTEGHEVEHPIVKADDLRIHCGAIVAAYAAQGTQGRLETPGFKSQPHHANQRAHGHGRRGPRLRSMVSASWNQRSAIMV